MASIMEIMQLCRLCLIKEQVNIPIFEDQGDIRQIFLKITACLPVKVSKEDQLPKKICDGCLYKLELLYQFWNTTANAEKQLLSWIEQSNMDLNSKPSEESSINTHPQVKQEKIEPTESTNENADLSADAQNYILQQQQLAYQANFPYKESQGSNVEGDDAVEDPEEPEPKRRRRGQRRQATKPIPPESLDSSDNEAADTLMEMTVTKTEEESESDGDENVDDPESSKFVTVAEDREQPGPSGLGKGTTEAPLNSVKQLSENVKIEITTIENIKISSDVDDSNDEDNENLLSRLKHFRDKKKNDKKWKAETEAIHCDVCDLTFKNSLDFGLHSMEHSNDKKYHCYMCTYTSRSTYHFEMHIRAHEGNTKYKCEICNKAFTVSTHATEHKYFHSGEKPFQCEICGKHFMFSWFLTSHRRQQHWEIMTGMPLVKYDCSICNKHYTSATGLKRHKISKHKKPGTKTEQSVLCDICGKSLASMEKLKFHSRIHTGYKPFSCVFCSKSFSRKEQVKEHERVHTGEKPYICKFCGKGFTQRSPLRIHERTHTGERPYECRLCSKGFISKGVMDTHLKTCQGKPH